MYLVTLTLSRGSKSCDVTRIWRLFCTLLKFFPINPNKNNLASNWFYLQPLSPTTIFPFKLSLVDREKGSCWHRPSTTLLFSTGRRRPLHFSTGQLYGTFGIRACLRSLCQKYLKSPETDLNQSCFSSADLSTSTVFMSGHSLGGVVLETYIRDHANLSSGIILFGSYLADGLVSQIRQLLCISTNFRLLYVCML